MALTSPPTPSRSQRSEQTRDRVLAVATELMAQKGYAGTTISAISKASGVMPASIYWHFESKEGLLAAVIERAAEAWFEGAARAQGIHTGHPVVDRPEHRQGLRYIFEERPDFYRVLMLIGLERGEVGGPPLEAVKRVRARLRARLSERVARALAEDGHDDAALAERLGEVGLVILDGLFVGQQIEPEEGDRLEARFDLFPLALHAVRTALTAPLTEGDAA